MAIDWTNVYAPGYGVQNVEIPYDGRFGGSYNAETGQWIGDSGAIGPLSEQQFVAPSIYNPVRLGQGTTIRPELQQYVSRYAFPGDAALGTSDGEGMRYYSAGIASPSWQRLVNADPASLSSLEAFYRDNPAAFGQYITRWSPETGQSTERQVFRYTPEEFAAAQGWASGIPSLGTMFKEQQSAGAQHSRDQAAERAAILEDAVPFMLLAGGLGTVLAGAGAVGAGAAGAAGGAGAADAAMWAGIGGADAAAGAGALGFTGEGLGALGAAGAAGGTTPLWAAGQAGTTFNTSMPWYAQLAEAQTLGGAGLTAAEMGSLGVSPWAAQIGAQTWIPQLTGPSQNSGLLGNLKNLPTSGLNGQLGGLPGATTDGASAPEFVPQPSTMQPMWGGMPNYQDFENVSFAGNAPTLLQRLGRIRNG